MMRRYRVHSCCLAQLLTRHQHGPNVRVHVALPVSRRQRRPHILLVDVVQQHCTGRAGRQAGRAEKMIDRGGSGREMM